MSWDPHSQRYTVRRDGGHNTWYASEDQLYDEDLSDPHNLLVGETKWYGEYPLSSRCRVRVMSWDPHSQRYTVRRSGGHNTWQASEDQLYDKDLSDPHNLLVGETKWYGEYPLSS